MKSFKCYYIFFISLLSYLLVPFFSNAAFADSSWNVVNSPNYVDQQTGNAYPVSLLGNSAISKNDIWAVGAFTDSMSDTVGEGPLKWHNNF